MDETRNCDLQQAEELLREMPPAEVNIKETAASKTSKTRQNWKLSEKMQTEICAMISVGCSARTAARLAGCSEAAIRKLAQRDEVFNERLRKAAMQRELFPLRNIMNASQTRWRAGAWYLARLNPDEYGHKKPEAVSPEMMMGLVMEISKAINRAVQDDDTLDRLRQVLKALLPRPNRREEMQPVEMPPGFDATAERKKKMDGWASKRSKWKA